MSELSPDPTDAAVPVSAPWDPFQLMDRLDEESLRRDLDGVPSDELVYVVKQGGREVVGLSKSGVDQCCMALVAQGQVIREEQLQYEIIGEGESREALFKVKAARLLPSGVRAQVIASARRGGQTRIIEERSTLSMETPARVGPYAPTEKQVAFNQRLAESPVFSVEERRRALEWLATKATRQTIKDQIDWLKRQVETRKPANAGASAA